jgi:hypothetical protein
MFIYHVEFDELKLGLNNMRGEDNFDSKVYSQHEHEVCAPCKSFIKVPHDCGNPLFVQKVGLISGT